MYTYCPNCSVVFQVSTAQLGRAGGRVRCGECRQVYNVIDYLYEDLGAVREAVEAAGSLEMRGSDEHLGGIDFEEYAVEEVTALEPEPELEPESELDAGLTPMVTGASWQQQSLQRRDVFSFSAIVVLLLLLGMQWTYFNRTALAAKQDWRPALERFCTVLRCDLPLRVDLSQLVMIDRDVRQHPAAANALLINAAFENHAGFTQPYPVFEVSFTDVTGNAIAIRRFLPAEYLHTGQDIAAGLPAQARVQLALEVQDPGDKAVSFQFGFL